MRIKADNNYVMILGIGLLVYAGLFTAASLARFYGLGSSVLDLGVFDQIFWYILHRGAPLSTINSPFIERHWFGFHFSPILYALAPVYALLPYPQTLLVLNVLLVTSAAIPIYLTARHWQISPGLALIWCAIFLVNPYVQGGVMWDFHEVAIAAPVMGFALYAVAARRKVLFLCMLLLLLLCKEHYGLTIAGFGLLWAIQYREYRSGMTISVLGIIAFIGILCFLMPYFSHSDYMALQNNNPPHARFAWMLHKDSMQNGIIFVALSDVIYIGTLLWLFWFIFPLYAFVWLLPAAGDMAVNALSYVGAMRSFYYYYSLSLMPVLIIAAMRGGLIYSHKKPKLKFSEITMLIFAANLLFGYIASPLPLPYAANIWETRFASLARPYAENIAQIKTMFPEQKILSVQDNIGSFFTRRAAIYQFPGGLDKADGVILHLHLPFTHALAILGPPFVIPTSKYISIVQDLLKDKQWGITYWQNGWLVLERNKPSIPVNKADIQKVLDDMLAAQ